MELCFKYRVHLISTYLNNTAIKINNIYLNNGIRDSNVPHNATKNSNLFNNSSSVYMIRGTDDFGYCRYNKNFKILILYHCCAIIIGNYEIKDNEV